MKIVKYGKHRCLISLDDEDNNNDLFNLFIYLLFIVVVGGNVALFSS